MTKPNAVKRKVGRPATGFDPFVGVRLPKEMIAAIDSDASKNEQTRSEAIRRILAAHLKKGGYLPKG